MFSRFASRETRIEIAVTNAESFQSAGQWIVELDIRVHSDTKLVRMTEDEFINLFSEIHGLTKSNLIDESQASIVSDSVIGTHTVQASWIDRAGLDFVDC